MTTEQYRQAIDAMTDEALTAEILLQRERLAGWDKVYGELRESGGTPGDDVLAESTEVRARLRLAERLAFERSERARKAALEAAELEDDADDLEPGQCNCATLAGVHAFGAPGCEHHDHHCEDCHEKGICTAAACRDGGQDGGGGEAEPKP